MLSLVSFVTSLLNKEKHEGITVGSVLDEFRLDNTILLRMIDDMDMMMEAGLIGGLRTSTIAMLPSFVPALPDGSEKGKFLAMDLGGTNLRVLIMNMDGKDDLETDSRNYRIPNSAMVGTGRQLFDFIVSCLASFLEEKGLMDCGLSLGFTFSYPCDQVGLRSARLLRWTKGFNASGVEGYDVVELLEDAIARRGDINVKVAALMNDTVGTMVAAALDHSHVALGVIIATGTNCAYMEQTAKIRKLKSNPSASAYDTMIIDTEWGGFGDGGQAEYIKTRYDKIVDDRSVHPGRQCFDKLVAGMYMGELVRLVLEHLVENQLLFGGVSSDVLMKPGSFPTKYISEILSDQSGHLHQVRQILDELAIEEYSYSDILIVKEVCVVVSRRSANLAAAAIACVLNRLKLRKATVGVDGSTYRFHPFFHSWVKEKLEELLQLIKCETQTNIVQAQDGSGKGAALVACLATKLAQNDSN